MVKSSKHHHINEGDRRPQENESDIDLTEHNIKSIKGVGDVYTRRLTTLRKQVNINL